MKTQYDHPIRTIALNNLYAMCLRVSGTAHVYQVEKVSRSRVTVSCSNPDEYGSDHPMFAVFPAIPGFEEDNPLIVLHGLRYYGNDADFQDFQVLFDCPTLYPHPDIGNRSAWRTEGEIALEKLLENLPSEITEDTVRDAIKFTCGGNVSHEEALRSVVKDCTEKINPGFYTKAWARNWRKQHEQA